MTLEQQTEIGKIIISNEAVATLAGIATIECYGIVGMSPHRLKDGVGSLLGKESVSKGVEIIEKNNEFSVKVHIIVGYGTKISQIAQNVMQKVQYALKEYCGVRVDNVQVVVDSVRLVD